jgi:chemotaxis protein MotB
MVDALTLVLAAFVLITLIALVVQRGLIADLRDREAQLEAQRSRLQAQETRLAAQSRELERLAEEKARLARRLRALARSGAVEVDDGRVILQGEVLFDSGSDELRPQGQEMLARLAPALQQLLVQEPDHMVLVGGHTDDRPIKNGRFASNWELSSARALGVARVLLAAGLAPERVVAAGFGPHQPRGKGTDEDSRRRNRRIEVQVVPIRSVGGR